MYNTNTMREEKDRYLDPSLHNFENRRNLRQNIHNIDAEGKNVIALVKIRQIQKQCLEGNMDPTMSMTLRIAGINVAVVVPSETLTEVMSVIERNVQKTLDGVLSQPINIPPQMHYEEVHHDPHPTEKYDVSDFAPSEEAIVEQDTSSSVRAMTAEEIAEQEVTEHYGYKLSGVSTPRDSRY